MFVRVKRNASKGIAYEYLQIVRSYREGGQVRQQIIGSLRRRDKLGASGDLDGLLKSLAGYGKFVLTTNTDLPTAEVAQTYKSLCQVERTFREQKSTLEVRPIYHQRDDTSMGHIVTSFLALRLEVDLQQCLEEREVKVSWPDLMRDLKKAQPVLLELDGQPYQLRTDLLGAAHQVFVAAGVRPPSPVTHLGPVS